MPSGKGAEGKFRVTDYKLSVHYGICVGPVDAFGPFKINDKIVNVTGVRESGSTETNVNDPDLFGGPKKGGGIKGTIHGLFGSPNQNFPWLLAAKMGRTPLTMTNYRHIFSIFFRGQTDSAGFTWGSNIPSVPNMSVVVTRKPAGMAWTEDDPMIGDNANPSHIIYECMVNDDWGAGYETPNMKTDSFLAAAQKLRDENFGLSLLWVRASTVEQFVNEILEHISATLIFDLVTSQWELKLLRDDYETEGLPVLDPSNSGMLGFQRRSWGETVNEVIVTWTNPETEEEETVTQQDASGFEIQKTSVSDASKNYLGIRNQELAWKVAERDLRQAGTPLAAIELAVSAKVPALKSGDVVVVDWYELDDEGEVFLEPTFFRVTKVKRPGRGMASMQVSLIEDIFSYGASATAAQPGAFGGGRQEPVDVTTFDFVDSPYYLVARQLGDSRARQIEAPQSHVSVLIDTKLDDIRDVELFSLRSIPNAGTEYISVGGVNDSTKFESVDTFPREIRTTISIPPGTDLDNLTVGGFVIIGAGTPQEICLIESFSTSASEVTVLRGCLDTVPSIWSAGATVWIVPRNASLSDRTEVITGETLTYKMLPVTSKRRLSLSEATARTFVPSDRLLRPLRPANVGVNGPVGFSATVAASASSMSVAWSNRNRITETQTILKWDDTSVSPEAGQTTRVQLRRNGSIIASVDGVTGNSVSLDLTGVTLTQGEQLEVRLFAVRDGFLSWQPTIIDVTVT